MRHTESGLRRLLTAYGREPAGGEPPAHLEAIVRRARRIRRTRRALTTGASLACAVAAAGLVNTLLTGPPQPARTADQPVDSAEVVEPGPKLPGAFLVALGAKNFTMPMLDSQRFATMGTPRTVTFTPTSVNTGYTVVCDDPKAWVIISQRLKGGETGGSIGPCGRSVNGHHDELSVPSSWLERPQSLEIWVFPGDAQVEKLAKEKFTCPPKSRACAEDPTVWALHDPGTLKWLSAEIGERPGRWAVGIYDRPASPAAGS